MAKRQTRKSVSIDSLRYRRLAAFASSHSIPIAQVVAQAIDAVIEKRLELRPAVDSHEMQVETLVRTGQLVPRSEPAIARNGKERRFTWGPKSPPPQIPAFPPGAVCAICAADVGGEPLHRESLGNGEPEVNVCKACRDEPVSSPRYSFSGGAGSRGIGDGNRRVGTGGGA